MNNSATLDNKNSMGFRFWQVSTLWERSIKTSLRPYDLTYTQYVVLAVTQELNEKEVDCTQKRISDFSMIDVMTLSTTIRLLEKKKLLERTEHATDTRAKCIVNTSSGRYILSRVKPIVRAVDENFFTQLDEKIDDFNSCLLMLHTDK